MNKKLIMALVATLITLPLSAKAAEPTQNQLPTIAIIDTALDTSLSLFKDRIAYEVCIVEFETCPNGKPFMEGPGASVLPANIITKFGLDHGTQMASLAVKTNMTVKIVFIRIAGVNPNNGAPKPRSEKTLDAALDWVIANHSKFNIQAVSMSQSTYNVTRPTLPFYMSAPGTDYCPKYPASELKVNQLLSLGIPSFFPTGNNSDRSRISWPACIPSSIAIGAAWNYGEWASYSNNDPKLVDFYSRGNNEVLGPNNKISFVNGTSGSTVIAATSWATVKSAKPNLTYAQLYELLAKTSTLAKGTVNGKIIDLAKALNG
jgi:hypothetical protein